MEWFRSQNDLGLHLPGCERHLLLHLHMRIYSPFAEPGEAGASSGMWQKLGRGSSVHSVTPLDSVPCV